VACYAVCRSGDRPRSSASSSRRSRCTRPCAGGRSARCVSTPWCRIRRPKWDGAAATHLCRVIAWCSVLRRAAGEPPGFSPSRWVRTRAPHRAATLRVNDSGVGGDRSHRGGPAQYRAFPRCSLASSLVRKSLILSAIRLHLDAIRLDGSSRRSTAIQSESAHRLRILVYPFHRPAARLRWPLPPRWRGPRARTGPPPPPTQCDHREKRTLVCSLIEVGWPAACTVGVRVGWTLRRQPAVRTPCVHFDIHESGALGAARCHLRQVLRAKQTHRGT